MVVVVTSKAIKSEDELLVEDRNGTALPVATKQHCTYYLTTGGKYLLTAAFRLGRVIHEVHITNLSAPS